MKALLRKIFSGLLLLLPLATSNAFAVCVQTSASTADVSLWNNHGCWQTFFLWQFRAYDLRSGEWSNRGWSDACNVNLEFPKHWNASYLVTYGLADNNDKSFHGTVDYRGTAEANSSQYHGRIYHTITDRSDVFGSYSPSSGALATSCLLYDASSANGNPGSRAGDYMHEGWHAWMQKHKYNNGAFGGHQAKAGNCTASNFCDYFYFHGIGAYAFGAMWENNGTASRFHSPNQVQVEFLCDVADYPQPWVAESVRQAAKSDANARAAQRFINGPGYSCGDPRPW